MDNIALPEIILLIEKLQATRLFFDTEAFEFYIDYSDKSRYSICPIDAIPFGRTGHNGIHFAFLTDFKTKFEYENLPIICIAPSYDPPVNLVAANIYDFFSLLMTIHLSTLLADDYQNHDDFIKKRNEFLEGFRSETKYKRKREEQAEFISKKFNLRRIENVVNYLSEIKRERSKIVKTYIPQYSTLGVNPIKDEQIKKIELTKDLNKISEFLNSSNKSSRLQFYRDCTNYFILSEKHDSQIRDLIIEYLVKDEYFVAAENLKKY